MLDIEAKLEAKASPTLLAQLFGISKKNIEFHIEHQQEASHEQVTSINAKAETNRSQSDKPSPVGNGIKSAREEIEDHVKRITALRIEAESDENVGFADRVRILTQETKALELYARVTGELSMADEAKLTQTPKFQRLVHELTNALKPFGPEVCKAAADAMSRVA